MPFSSGKLSLIHLFDNFLHPFLCSLFLDLLLPIFELTGFVLFLIFSVSLSFFLLFFSAWFTRFLPLKYFIFKFLLSDFNFQNCLFLISELHGERAYFPPFFMDAVSSPLSLICFPKMAATTALILHAWNLGSLGTCLNQLDVAEIMVHCLGG